MESRMRYRMYILLFALLACMKVYSQPDMPLASQAASLCESRDFEQARIMAEKAIADPDEKRIAYTWYVAGFVYKEIYKNNEAGQRNSASRKTAVQYLKNALSLDKAGDQSQNIKSALRYLAVSYFNDALKKSKEITAETQDEPEVLYQEFRNTMRVVNVATDFSEYDKQIFKALGQTHYKLWETDIYKNAHASKCAEYYQKVLMIDPEDCEARFNLVILYYNQGVHKIRSLGTATDMSELIPTQEAAIRLFNKAMPYAKETFETCSPKTEYYKGLMFCYRALGNEEEYERLKKELEEKIASGQIQQKK